MYRQLSVDYRTSGNDQFTDRSSLQFERGHYVKITILSVEGVSHSALKLESAIHVDRLYGFDPNISPTLTVPTSGNTNDSGQYTISWTGIDEAEEYQLEWLHINNYRDPNRPSAPINLSYDFSRNATRITTKNTFYNISPVFEQGHVLFRVRAVTYETLDNKHAIPGRWSCEAEGNCSGTDASAYARRIDITAATRHTADRLNWQYISSYAEEGKKKEVVTYYDGTMRSHQTVTRLNTDNSIIVGETYYDHRGRPAVQSMPVPLITEQPGDKRPLKYFPNFNRRPDGTAYNWRGFDKEGDDPCVPSADPMQTASGASRYYSPNNPDQDGFNRFIPDAEGYPFSQIEYTADHTGRIKRQGGVGPNYQLGSGRETRYLYGTPTQDELNRLFGSEVGYKNHYRKNAVVDANGAISVSYIDMHGRVIATALARKSGSRHVCARFIRRCKRDDHQHSGQPSIKYRR
jgi:hypothetical protein